MIRFISVTGSMSASLSSIPSSIMSFASSAANKKHLPRSELIDRYKLLINRATEYLQFSCKFQAMARRIAIVQELSVFNNYPILTN